MTFTRSVIANMGIRGNDQLIRSTDGMRVYDINIF